jgi:hypothetical protein
MNFVTRAKKIKNTPIINLVDLNNQTESNFSLQKENITNYNFDNDQYSVLDKILSEKT